MVKAIVYTRFSPRRNGDQCMSCEVQLDYCRKHADSRGYDIEAVFNDESVSGKSELRPKLWEAVNSVPRNGILLVYKLDRLARNVYLSECIRRTIEKRGGSIEAVSGDVEGDSPEATMIRQVLAAFAEYERKLTAMRTSAAMRHHQAAGRRMSAIPPYGWKVDPSDREMIIEDKDEQKTIAFIKSCYLISGSYSKVVRDLEKTGIKPRGKMWHRKTIKMIVEKE